MQKFIKVDRSIYKSLYQNTNNFQVIGLISESMSRKNG